MKKSPNRWGFLRISITGLLVLVLWFSSFLAGVFDRSATRDWIRNQCVHESNWENFKQERIDKPEAVGRYANQEDIQGGSSMRFIAWAPNPQPNGFGQMFGISPPIRMLELNASDEHDVVAVNRILAKPQALRGLWKLSLNTSKPLLTNRLGGLSQVVELSIRCRKFSQVDISSVGRMRSLQILHLSISKADSPEPFSRVAFAGLTRSLKDCSTLRWIDVQEKTFSPEQLDEMRAAIPQAAITQ